MSKIWTNQMVQCSLIKTTSQMVHILPIKKSPYSQQTCQNQLVQNDKVVFLTPI
jgi:hypothetical protein